MSEKPLLQRLQAKDGRSLAVRHAPKDRTPLFAGAATAALGQADVVVVFAATRREMAERLAALKSDAKSDAILWLAYAKKTSPLAGEIHRDIVHEFAPRVGLDAVAQIALDADYSALRLKRLG